MQTAATETFPVSLVSVETASEENQHSLEMYPCE